MSSPSAGKCGYVAPERYRYWGRSDALETLTPLPAIGCPFGGPHWQLWVNHALAHAEAKATRCARGEVFPMRAKRGGAVFAPFAALLGRPETGAFVALDALNDRIE